MFMMIFSVLCFVIANIVPMIFGSNTATENISGIFNCTGTLSTLFTMCLYAHNRYLIRDISRCTDKLKMHYQNYLTDKQDYHEKTNHSINFTADEIFYSEKYMKSSYGRVEYVCEQLQTSLCKLELTRAFLTKGQKEHLTEIRDILYPICTALGFN